MSEIFASTFNAGGTDWTTNGGAYKYIGEDFTRCLACSFSAVQNIKTITGFTTAVAGTWRCQFAAIPGTTPGQAMATANVAYAAGGGNSIGSVLNNTGTGAAAKFNLLFAIAFDSGDTSQGQLIIRYARGGFTGNTGSGDSLPKVNPRYVATDVIADFFDGNWHGIQIRWTADFGTQLMTLITVVDDIEVGNATLSIEGWQSASPGIAIPMIDSSINTLFATQAGPDGNAMHYIIENVHLNDTSTLFSWPGLTNAPQLTSTSCTIPTNLPTITGLNVVDCDASPIDLVITGENFADGCTIALQGPSGREFTFTIDSQTDTEIVLTDLDPLFINGDYCVTVTNPF